MDNPNKEWRDVDPININVTDEHKTNDSAARVSPRKRDKEEKRSPNTYPIPWFGNSD